MIRRIGFKYIKKIPVVCLYAGLLFCYSCGKSQPGDPGDGPDSLALPKDSVKAPAPLRTGAEVLLGSRMDLVEGRRVAVIANHTSLVGGVHLVDSLHALGVDIRKVFAPEHGFRGDQDAGAHITDGKDAATGLPVVSLYGSNKKPSASMLADVDVVLFDIQDVGARFYTYISTMSLAMEACAEEGKAFIVLDRPNPNGWYVDGPVLEEGMESFVGMHQIPIVHGMTVGEYARMVNFEGWLAGGAQVSLEVVACEGYSHDRRWESLDRDWVAPSPNLPTPYSAYLYPALCWFEATPVSIGRGTDFPFQIVGAPWHKGYKMQTQADSIAGDGGTFVLHGLEFEYVKFTPHSIPGKSTHPKFEDETCYGGKPRNEVSGKQLFLAGLQLLRNFDEEAVEVSYGKPMFQPFFLKLTGSKELSEQIRSEMSVEEIYESWQPGIKLFKNVRRKYLLYPDFE